MATNKDTEQDDDSIKSAQFQQWLSSPLTQLMLNAIRKHREEFVELVSNNSMSETHTDQFIRLKATGIRNTDAVLLLITNYEAMKKKVTK
jgi:hypothetical protein